MAQRILIVDDEPANIKTLGEALKTKFDVIFALNGPDALQAASSQNPPDLILLDIIMPGMDGYEVCEKLKSGGTGNIPVIFITCKTEEDDEYRGLYLGAVDYIMKPFNPAIVKARVSTHLELKKHHDHLETLVEERSAELIKLNKQLQREISERIKMENRAKIHQEQLIQADKMVALGTLVSGVAHEINNPNNFIMLNAPMLKKIWEHVLPVLDDYYDENDDSIIGFDYKTVKSKFFQACSNILEGSKRIKHIVDDLQKFSRRSVTEVSEQVDVNSVVNSSVNLLGNLIKNSTDRFFVEYGELPFISCNYQHLEQVVINLIHNSCQAITEKSKGLYIKTAFNEADGHVEISIEDEGIGIPADHIPRVTEPFFTTKRDSGGTGLGLTVSNRIINGYGGKLEFVSTPGEGTTATVFIPTSRKMKPESEDRQE